MQDRELDIVLLGATGFTGGLTAAALAAQSAGTGLRWAVAGRDATRLAAVRDGIIRGGGAGPAIEVVDVRDDGAMHELTARTRVLATTVGPYSQLGLPVAAACVATATHYADITGEPDYVDELLVRYDDAARAAGVALVTCCGFDSVPHDLGVWWTVQQLPEDRPITVRGYVRATGRISGGTAASALGAAATWRRSRRPEGATSPDAATATRPRRPTAELPRRPHRSEVLGAYGLPLPTIDASIVLRSAQVLDGYGSRFRYGHYAQLRHLPTAVLAGAGTGIGLGLLAFPPTRLLVARALPDPGSGPDAATRARSRFAVTFVADAGDAPLVTRVSGGDPGYGETSRWLAAAALTLAGDERPATAGVLTPAVGLGEPYLRRLDALGVRREVVQHLR